LLILDFLKNFKKNMPKIKIYTTPFCVYCKEVKEFLSKNNLDYLEIDVSQDEKALNYIVSKTGQIAVPVIEINNEIIVGFDKNKILRALNLV
jgi:glutaredoxin-like YruB-family protein